MSLTRASAAVIKTEELVNNRNLIINGAMQIAQRNTSVTGITSSGYYTADRWNFLVNSAGTWTMNVESSGPTNTEFRKSANVICTTADSSLAAGDFINFRQRIEGQNVQGIKKGTSAAESLTVSFWVKSSNTGTYICEFFDLDNSRQISPTYTIDAADTWEKKTITVPPDTTGQFDNDNASSLYLNFWLASGTTFSSGTLNDSAWASSTNADRVVGQLNLANAVGNYWAVTGVQLETGSTATPYEWKNYGSELALCQRYCIVYGGSDRRHLGIATMYTSTAINLSLHTPTTMRAQPTLTKTLNGSSEWLEVYVGASGTNSNANLELGEGGDTNNFRLYCTGAHSGSTAGYAAWVQLLAGAKLTLSAEL